MRAEELKARFLKLIREQAQSIRAQGAEWRERADLAEAAALEIEHIATFTEELPARVVGPIVAEHYPQFEAN